MSKELVNAIKKAANYNQREYTRYFTGEVLAQDDGTAYNADEYTIVVRLITDMAGADVTNVEPNTNNNDPNRRLGNNILRNVHLMASVDDGILLIPTIGSMVVVLTSTTQQPLVVQYSSIDTIQSDLLKSYIMDVGMDDKTGVFTISASESSVVVTDGDKNASLVIAAETIDLKVETGSDLKIGEKIEAKSKNNCTLDMDTGIAIKTSGNAEINAETLITIKNGVTSLLTIMTDLVTALNTGSNSGGPVVFAADPGFAALLIKINALLGA